MPSDTICKTIHQYNKYPVSGEDMEKLCEIAEDYGRVKNYVYDRFGGISGLPKIYPGYTVQNEMTESGLRGELNLPSVYFYLAVFDALGDIKCQWTRTKSKILELVKQNGGLTAEEKHYLRFLLKVSNAFEAVLTQRPVKLQKEIQSRYESLACQVDAEKLHRYLCRQVRKHYVRQHTAKQEGFSISERAYRYADHGIYISVKEKRRRIFIPLTDGNGYRSQLYIRLFPAEGKVEIKAPVRVAVRRHEAYKNRVGISLGIRVMLTTHEGHSYGGDLGKYQFAYADWIRMQTISYNRNKKDNPGRKKYQAIKRRLEEQMHGYINQELNRFLRTEMPQTVYMAKLPKPMAGGVNKKINNSVALWQRGYIRGRLAQKCAENGVELLEVLGKGISRECSQCGAAGVRKDGIFHCLSCGFHAEEKTNTAGNARNRGLAGKTVK